MKLHLQLSVDRLGPEYQAGKVYYSLLVSAAFEPARDEVLEAAMVWDFLRPWTWQAYPALSVFTRPEDQSTAWSSVAATIVPASPPTGLPHLVDALDEELKIQIATFQPEDFVWVPSLENQSPIQEKVL